MKNAPISLLTSLCVFTLAMTACTQSNTPSSQVSEKANSTVATTASTNGVASTASSVVSATVAPINTAIVIDPKSFVGHETAGALAVAMSNFILKNLNEVSDLKALPADKKACLLNSTHRSSLPIFDSYFAKKLSANELKKTNNFYGSDLGQKLIIASDQKIKQQAGMSVDNPVTLTEDDRAKLKAFSTTPEGKKLMGLFSPVNQLEMQRDVIEPMLESEFKACDVKVAGIN